MFTEQFLLADKGRSRKRNGEHPVCRRLFGQRNQFFIKPVIGFPLLWWRLLRQSYSLMRAAPGGIEPPPSQQQSSA